MCTHCCVSEVDRLQPYSLILLGGKINLRGIFLIRSMCAHICSTPHLKQFRGQIIKSVKYNSWPKQDMRDSCIGSESFKDQSVKSEKTQHALS